MEGGRPRAVVVGGSIAGLCSAHVLIASGWQVTILEKSAAPPVSSPTGAGLGLEPLTMEIISRWVSDDEAFKRISRQLSVELHHEIDSVTKERRVLAKDEELSYNCVHWSDLHCLLYDKLIVTDVEILWGHRFLSLEVVNPAGGGVKQLRPSAVTARAQIIRTGDIIQVSADLLVGADGSLSQVRKHFLPDFRPRYRGYFAWRGVFNYSEEDDAETLAGLRKALPDLRRGLHFEMAGRTHCVLLELERQRINWVWFFNGPEPELQGNSLTSKVTSKMIEEMHKEADRVWDPDFARMIKSTKNPFINAIYDSDPLPQLYFENSVVLIGDSAHPCTPHGSRSTTMAVQDAEALGLAIRKWGVDNMETALRDFQSVRLPVVTQQVLRSRVMGLIRMGLDKTFDLNNATEEDCKVLQLKHMPFMNQPPVLP